MRDPWVVIVAVALSIPGRLSAVAPAPNPLPPGAVAQLGSTRFQHSSIGRAIAFSPDGKFLATGGSDNSVCVWDATTGNLVRTHSSVDSALYVKWKADGKLAALTDFGVHSYFMHEWAGEMDKGVSAERIQELSAAVSGVGKEGFTGGALLSADARQVVVVRGYRDRDPQAEVFPFTPNAASALIEVKHSIPLGKGLHDIRLSGDGKTLIVSGYGVKGGERVAAFDLTAVKDHGKPTWEFSYPSPDDHRLMNCLSTDGKRVVLQFLNGDMELWDGPAGKLVRDLPMAPGCDSNPGAEQPGLGISPDGKRFAIAIRRKNGEVGGQVIDLETGRKLVVLSSGPMPPLAGGIAFSPDGKRLALASYGFVRVWDAETGRDVGPPTGHRGRVESVVASPDGRTVVTAGADLTVRAWDPATGTEKWKVVFSQPVLVSFTTADAVVVEHVPSFDLTGGPEEPLLDLATGKARALPGDMAKGILGNDPQRFWGPVLTHDCLLALAPDRKSAVTLESQQPALRVWSWPEGKFRKSLPLDVPRDLAVTHVRARFSPDGKELVSVTHCRVLIPAASGPGDAPILIDRWDTASGKRLDRKPRNLVGVRPVWTAGGSRLLAVWNEGKIKDAFSGKSIGRLPHSNTDPFIVLDEGGMALSPDGKRIAIGRGYSGPGAARIFDVQTGRLLATLPGDGRGWIDVAYLPDGQLVTAGETAIVWSADAAEKVGLPKKPGR